MSKRKVSVADKIYACLLYTSSVKVMFILQSRRFIRLSETKRNGMLTVMMN